MMKKNKLLQLFQSSEKKRNGLEVKASEDSDVTEIFLYDAIGDWYGISAQDFIQTLNSVETSNIKLRINCPGGDVFEARAMATAIKEHSAKIIAQIDSLAASAATYIAIACDEVHIAQGAFFMIHKAWSFAIGNSDELRETADLLDKIDATIIHDYIQKTGLKPEQFDEWMSVDTWFTAEEAVEHGFADKLLDSKSTENHWNLSAYKNTPKALSQRTKYNRADIERRLDMYLKTG